MRLRSCPKSGHRCYIDIGRKRQIYERNFTKLSPSLAHIWPGRKNHYCAGETPMIALTTNGLINLKPHLAFLPC
jgi:hypothetical protein